MTNRFRYHWPTHFEVRAMIQPLRFALSGRNPIRQLVAVASVLCAFASPAKAAEHSIVATDNGKLQGTAESGAQSIHIFRGIPFAAPPIGDLRWREPQPVKRWTGIRPATEFAPRCMQQPLYSDMMCRAPGTSADCLYLNVWPPAKLDGPARAR